MTLRDIYNDGITMESGIKVKSFDEKSECYKTLFKDENFDNSFYRIPDDVLGMEIKYMYAINNCLHIEVKNENCE